MGVQPISACIVNRKSTVFYVDKYGWVRFFSIKNDDDLEETAADGRVFYGDDILTIGGEKIKSTTKDLVALSYPLANSDIIRSRLFYSDDQGNLQGFEKEGSQDWTASGISELNAKVMKDTSITALVSPTSDAIKVYYFKDGVTERPYVAWWSPSVGKWLTEST